MSIPGITSHFNDEGNVTTYRVLTEAQIERILNNSFRVLESIGMDIDEPEAVKMLRDAGCTVDGTLVKIPREVVTRALSTIPNSITMYNRKGEPVMEIGGTNVYFGNGPTNPNVNDFETHERRAALVSDTEKATLISDACPNIDFVMNLADPSDCPVAINDVYTMRAMLMNTTKPIMCLARDVTTMDEQFQMVTAVAGGWEAYRAKPFVMSLCGDPITPLGMEPNGTQKLMYCAKNSIPASCPSGGQLGSTAPVTLPAGLALVWAEQLLCITLTQLVNPGSPYIGCAGLITTDMKTMMPCYATPEHAIEESAAADISRYLGLPFMDTAACDSKMMDEQAAIEGTVFAVTAALDGGQIVHDIGFLDSAMTTDYGQIVMMDEIIGYAKQIKRGVVFDEDDDDIFEAIEEVGPKGEFLTSEHTYENYAYIWYPTIIYRDNYDKWVAAGKKDMRTRVYEKTAKILSEHKPEPLSEEAQAKVDAVLAAAHKRVTGEDL